MTEKKLDNWGVYDVAFAGVDLIKTSDGRYHPHVSFVLDEENEKDVGDRGLVFFTSNSYGNMDHAYWDTRVNLENLGFYVSPEVTIFDEDGNEINNEKFTSEASQGTLQ